VGGSVFRNRSPTRAKSKRCTRTRAVAPLALQVERIIQLKKMSVADHLARQAAEAPGRWSSFDPRAHNVTSAWPPSSGSRSRRRPRREGVGEDSTLLAELHHFRAARIGWLAAEPEATPQTGGLRPWGFPPVSPSHPSAFPHHGIQRITLEFSAKSQCPCTFAPLEF
jgi:hypothetical protein